MDRYLIVPGYTNSSPEHWQSRWEDAWGRDALRIQPGSWDRPELEDWVGAVDRAAGRVRPQARDRLVVVAHSLGTWAAAEWLGRARPRNTVAFLVAVPDLHADSFPSADAASFTRLEAQPLPCPALVVASEDDPYSGLVASRRAALGWGARWTSAGALGHINSVSNLGMWEQGQQLLAGLH